MCGSASESDRANSSGDGNDVLLVPPFGRFGDENAVGKPPDEGNNAAILSFNIDMGPIVDENDGENEAPYIGDELNIVVFGDNDDSVDGTRTTKWSSAGNTFSNGDDVDDGIRGTLADTFSLDPSDIVGTTAPLSATPFSVVLS